MTTTVTINTAEWPVLVTPVEADAHPDNQAQPVTVPPNAQYQLHVWQGREINIKELPQP